MMDLRDADYWNEVEDKVEKIRTRALAVARVIDPDVEFVIDRFSVDDYSEKHWDYPGKWYVEFRLPDGFKSEEEVIKDIVEETLRFYQEKKKR